MKTSIFRSAACLVAIGILSGCTTPVGNHDHHGGFLLGAATDKNVAAHSIRSVDVPNSKGLTGQSGERAVAAIGRLNSGDVPDLAEVSASDVGN